MDMSFTEVENAGEDQEVRKRLRIWDIVLLMVCGNAQKAAGLKHRNVLGSATSARAVW